MVLRSIAISTMVGLLTRMQCRLFNKDKLGSDTAKHQGLLTGGVCVYVLACAFERARSADS